MLFNFCDSSFSIGAGNFWSKCRYIKQIKERFTQQMYDDENVIVCEITKPVNFYNFLMPGYGKKKLD